MKKFKQYYLLPFIGLGGIAFFGLYQNWNSLDWQLILFLVFAGVIAPLLIGRLRDWTANTFAPRKRKKVYYQEPFLSLEKLGFKNVNDFYFEGVYKGYTIYVIYDHSWNIAVNFIYFYHPIEISDKVYNAMLKKVVRSKFQLSLSGNLLSKIETNFKVCTFEKIQERLDLGVDFLVDNNNPPIRPTELQKMYDKLNKK